MSTTHSACRADGCNREAIAKGLCTKHYQRMKKTGALTLNRKTRVHIAFISRLGLVDECEIWPFGVSPTSGYGVVNFEGKQTSAHRAALMFHRGNPPTQHHHAAHDPNLCQNKLCVNPRHLRWATPKENAADKKIAGTETRGSLASGKLTDSDVISIYYSRDTNKNIASKHGITDQTVARIKSGFSWSWLTGASRI